MTVLIMVPSRMWETQHRSCMQVASDYCVMLHSELLEAQVGCIQTFKQAFQSVQTVVNRTDNADLCLNRLSAKLKKL